MKKRVPLISVVSLSVFVLFAFLAFDGAFAATVRFSGDTIPDVVFQIPLPGLAGVSGADIAAGKALGLYIRAAHRWLVGIAAILAVLAMTWGGIQWLISRGESGKVQEARKVIWNALCGLLLALGSYVILSVISPNLAQFKPLVIKPIQGIVLKLAKEHVEEYKEAVSVIRSDLTADDRTYNALFKKYADKYGIDCTFIKAMVYQESGFVNLHANSSGAVGLFQVVHTKYGRPSESELLDPETNARWGVGILRDAFRDPCPASCGKNSGFAGCKKPTNLKNVVNDDNTGFTDGIQYALAAYNGGVCGANQTSENCSGKARWQCPGEVVNPHTGTIDETLKHVRRVFEHYKKMKDNNWGC